MHPPNLWKRKSWVLLANRFTTKEPKDSHKPFKNFSDRKIKTARAQAKTEGPGVLVEKVPQYRIRLNQRQLHHYLEFTMRPYYYQYVAYGTSSLKLESGEEPIMPNVVRTVARCTIINQYLDHCQETGFQPIMRARAQHLFLLSGFAPQASGN